MKLFSFLLCDVIILLFIPIVVTGQHGDCETAIKLCSKSSMFISQVKGSGVFHDENAVVCEITWNYPSLPGLHDFLVYRSLNGGPLRAYKTVTVLGNPNMQLQGTVFSYTIRDEELRFGKTYVYKVMAQFVDGGYSPMSNQVSFGL